MRLRAPEEPEADDFGDGSALSTPERVHPLPPLDVGSPDYIEERLENLKRRPNWGDFLDQYVQDHPDSDSDGEDDDFKGISAIDVPGFIRSILWSLLVVALAPMLVLCTPCLRHKGYGFWPLGCRSMKELFVCALANVFFIVFGLVLLCWTICRELPDVFSLSNTLVKLNVQIDEVQLAADTCRAALVQWERAVVQELCMPVGIDAALLLLNIWLLLHCHRRWARYLMLLMAVMFVVDVPTKLYDATFPAPEIHKVDPTFAMVDEELLVALDGKNLKSGGSVAWVAYWGCAITSNVDMCDKQFVSTFEAGNVAVTFTSLDHFIPCYRDPPNPLKAQNYQCFEDVRIRVKDKQSIPGWSRSATQAASTSQAIKPTYRMARSAESLEAAEIDISAATGSFSESLSTESDEEAELHIEAVGLSGEEGTQENETLSRNSPQVGPNTDKVEAASADERVREIEVTSDAGVKMIHVKTDLDKTKIQLKAISADKIEEPEPTKDAIRIDYDALRIIDDEMALSTMTVILEEETMPDNQEERESEADVDTETSIYEAQSEKMGTSSTFAQGDELEASGSKQENIAPVETTETHSRPRDAAQSEKKRKKPKRKGQRSRQTKKASEPSVVDIAEVAAAAV